MRRDSSVSRLAFRLSQCYVSDVDNKLLWLLTRKHTLMAIRFQVAKTVHLPLTSCSKGYCYLFTKNLQRFEWLRHLFTKNLQLFDSCSVLCGCQSTKKGAQFPFQETLFTTMTKYRFCSQFNSRKLFQALVAINLLKLHMLALLQVLLFYDW